MRMIRVYLQWPGDSPAASAASQPNPLILKGSAKECQTVHICYSDKARRAE
jgi:hypothetical protein